MHLKLSLVKWPIVWVLHKILLGCWCAIKKIWVPGFRSFNKTPSVHGGGGGGGGYSHQNCMWMCLVDLKYLTFYTDFLPNFPPTHQYIILEKSTQFWPNWVLFYNNLPKIYSIYVIWAPSSLMKPPDRYTKFAKKHPKRQAHIGIPCQCENLPGCTPLSCSPTWKHLQNVFAYPCAQIYLIQYGF